jgi:hypothetical protein
MLLRLAYLGYHQRVALLRLLPGSDRDKDAEILALRHHLAVLHRQLGRATVRFEPADRAWLAAAGIDPAPARAATTSAQFLRSHTETLLAANSSRRSP